MPMVADTLAERQDAHTGVGVGTAAEVEGETEHEAADRREEGRVEHWDRGQQEGGPLKPVVEIKLLQLASLRYCTCYEISKNRISGQFQY